METQIVRGLDGRKLGTVIKSATKREVYMLDGNEISRETATKIALEHIQQNEPSAALVYVAYFRDCGTKDAPRPTKYGPMWREYQTITE